MANTIPQETIEAAQLQRILLENEKLSQEIAQAKERQVWYQVPLQLVPLITVIVSLLGFGWAIYQYLQTQEKSREDRKEQSVRESIAASRQIMKPWTDSQRATYLETLMVAEQIANGPEGQPRVLAMQKFWQLFHGRMILVETTIVSGAMKQFGECLQARDACTAATLNARLRALASAMAESMAATSGMSYEEFAGNRFKY